MNNFNLTEILYFPLRDSEARRQFLYVSIAMLAGFIIPLLPMIAVMGYAAQIAAGIIRDGKTLHMPPWKDLGKLLSEGFRLYGVQLAFGAPLIIGMLFFWGSYMLIPIAFISEDPNSFTPGTLALFFVPMLCMFPMMIYGVAVGILLPVAECHMLAKDEFRAGFRVKEWWPIFRANLGQFLLVYVIIMVVTMAVTILMQVLMITIVLACLLPLLMPAAMAYMTLVSWGASAVAYRNALAQKAPAETLQVP